MHSDKPFVERIVELYRELHVPVDMDLVCYTALLQLREGEALKMPLLWGSSSENRRNVVPIK